MKIQETTYIFRKAVIKEVKSWIIPEIRKLPTRN